MEKYFGWGYDQDPFELFSFEHIMTILVVLLFCVGVGTFRHFFRKNSFFRYGLAFILFLTEISYQYWMVYYDKWAISYSLPLQLSSVSLIFAIIMLLSRNKNVFAFVYFAGIGSALQAMLTPVIDPYSFPHFRYIHFYVAHGGVVLACMYMVFVEKYQPTIRSLWKSFLYLNMYTLFIFVVNWLVDSNYMFIMHKPSTASILDVLGPWPWYILSLECIALVSFFILLLPFLFHKKLERMESKTF